MSEKILVGEFFNCGYDGVAIIAIVNYCDVPVGDFYGGDIYDWAAYIGIGTAKNKEACAKQVAVTGVRLPRADAVHFFPSLPVWKLRR